MLLSRGPGNRSHHFPPLREGWGSGCGSRVALCPESLEAPGRQSGTRRGRGGDAPSSNSSLYFLTSLCLGEGWTDVTLGVLGRAPTRDLLVGIHPTTETPRPRLQGPGVVDKDISIV